MLSQKDLLLSTLDDGSGVEVVGLLELLSSDVAQLSIRDKALCFGTDELLLERDELRRLWLLVLELLDLILDLSSPSVYLGPLHTSCQASPSAYDSLSAAHWPLCS